jgi:Holliday junction resolvase RusA-like endonuclease
MMEWAIEIRVEGTPAPQGSKRHVGHGIMIESSAKVKPWREAVKFAAITTQIAQRGNRYSIDGPVVFEMVFTMRKPKSAPKGRRTWASTKPDLSKLIRSTEDALVDVGVIEDDARIVEYARIAKVFPGEDPDALTVPGAVIRIRRAI